MNNLQAAGLNSTEAKCYEALLELQDCKPSELAKVVNESRTNTYKILDKLVAYKLVERFEKGSTWHFRAANPTRLLQLAHERHAEQLKAERELETHVRSLANDYAKNHEQPGVRYYVGKQEIREIFAEQVKVAKPIHFIHTIAGIDFYGYGKMHNIRMMAVNAGIPRYALTPDTPKATVDYKETDKGFLLTRTWMQERDYTAPVEWGSYGDTTYIISYGKEALGMTIESPQIAESFRQLFAMLDRGQRAQPWYETLPRLAHKLAQRD